MKGSGSGVQVVVDERAQFSGKVRNVCGVHANQLLHVSLLLEQLQEVALATPHVYHLRERGGGGGEEKREERGSWG